MSKDFEDSAELFLELASNQRLAILNKLAEKKSKLSAIAKELDATPSEVFRNLNRLDKKGIISKDVDGNFNLTTYGKVLFSIIPIYDFFSHNKKYFKSHNFNSVPQKFVYRLAAFDNTQLLNSPLKVLDKWQKIYKNSSKYIYNVMSEIPYTKDLMDSLSKKLNEKIKVQSVFAESAIVSEAREEFISKMKLKKRIQEGLIERKMRKDVKVNLILNEKEGMVMFPTNEGEPDMSKAFFGNDEKFHEWCLDYFRYNWLNAGPFSESKLKKES